MLKNGNICDIIKQHDQGDEGRKMITIFDGNEEPRDIDLETFDKPVITLGRARDNDILLMSPLVSKYHMQFVMENGTWKAYDLNSTNGMMVDGELVPEVVLHSGDIIRITDETNSMAESVSIVYGTKTGEENWNVYPITGQNSVTIGRDEKCDISWNNSGVSKIHAVITRTQTGFELTDKSSSGIIVNGRKIQKSCELKAKDVFVIGNARLVFLGTSIRYIIYDNGVRVEARDITKTVHGPNGKFNIVNHISLKVEPGEFVAIIGGSGAGKSSFMNCISGYSEPTSGAVMVNEDELYENYETLKQLIGYVPQSDIVYDNLSVKDMLNYAAKLRMPKDTTRQERKKKVAEVISMVELEGKEKSMIKNLSGGQKKRVSIAVELVSDPTLFFLDEPSSGLDPGTEQNLMRTLRKMSRMGKTIILITHNTMNIHLCDKIIFLGKGGNLCYYGSPEEACHFFQVDQLVDVYNMVTEHSEEWKERFIQYSGNQQQEKENSKENANPKMAHKGDILKQTAIMTGRYFNLMFHDIKRLMMLILQAPILGVLLSLVANEDVYAQQRITKSILFAMACCAFWIGILNSIQEVCKERTILRREYLSGLSLTAYIMSKFIVLGFWCIVQSALLLGTFGALIGFPEKGLLFSPTTEFFVTTFLTAFSATAMGLFVSSLFTNADRAMTIAPILLMPQILFAGLAFELSGVVEKISYVITCRWSMDAFGASTNLDNLPVGDVILDAAEYSGMSLWTPWLILLGFSVVFGVLSYLALTNVEKS